MMKKINLNINFKYDYDFILIGICCALKDYQICYKLNKYLNTFLFRSNKDIEMKFYEANEKGKFSLYEYWNSQYQIQWYLLANKTIICCKPIFNEIKTIFNSIEKKTTITKHLIPEHKTIDYYIQIHGNYGYDKKKKIITKIKNIPQIVSVFEINISNLKSKENLILE